MHQNRCGVPFGDKWGCGGEPLHFRQILIISSESAQHLQSLMVVGDFGDN